MGGGGTGGDGPSKISSGGKEVLKTLSLNLSNSCFSILVLLCHFFVHLKNSTLGNTGTDAARLVHVHHLANLGQHIML